MLSDTGTVDRGRLCKRGGPSAVQPAVGLKRGPKSGRQRMSDSKKCWNVPRKPCAKATPSGFPRETRKRKGDIVKSSASSGRNRTPPTAIRFGTAGAGQNRTHDIDEIRRLGNFATSTGGGDTTALGEGCRPQSRHRSHPAEARRRAGSIGHFASPIRQIEATRPIGNLEEGRE